MRTQSNPVLIDKNHVVSVDRIYEVRGDETGLAIVVFYDNHKELLTLHSSYTFSTVVNAWEYAAAAKR